MGAIRAYALGASLQSIPKHLSLCRLSQVKLPERVGCIGLTEDPNVLLAALHRRIVLFDLKQQKITRYSHDGSEH